MARKRGPYLGTSWTHFYHPRTEKPRPTMTIIPYGPQGLYLRDVVVNISGPRAFVDAHPEKFHTASTTADEGFFYWGLLKIRGPEGYEGGWRYQSGVQPGGQKVGGATVDFLIDVPDGRPIACRIVTPFHEGGFIFAGPEKEASDELQQFTLEDQGYDVIDAYSKLWMSDESGEAVKRAVQHVIDKDPTFDPNSFAYIGGF